MKALSLTQPWASLVAEGAKQIETRSWGTHYRGPLAIHAAKALPKNWTPFRVEAFVDALEPLVGLNDRDVPNIDRLPRGALLAVVVLSDVVSISGVPFDPVPGYAVSDEELAFGDYTPGRAAWILERVEAMPEPIECKGALGLWNVTAEMLG